MIWKLLEKLENPKIPLLGPNVFALQFWGLLLPDNIFKKYMYMVAHTFVILFTASEYVGVWFVKSDMKLLLNNLKVTMLATMSVIKVTTILKWQKDWKTIIDYVTRADLAARNTEDVIKITLINKYTIYSRWITYIYWILTYATGAIVIIQPLLKYILSPTYRNNAKAGVEPYLEVVISWVPFDKTTSLGYLGASLIQAFSAVYGTGWISSYDSNSIVIMVFFKGELELLKMDCQNIFGSKENPVTENEAMKRLKGCQTRHAFYNAYTITKNFHLFNSCLSPIMFFYMIVCSIMLCVTAYEINIESNPMQRLLMSEYLVFGITQLFLYCWHSNEVFYMSQEMISGPYESIWWSHKGLRKNLFILMAQLNKTLIFTAGPFATLTVATFINILKGAYSYYTLLKSAQKT